MAENIPKPTGLDWVKLRQDMDGVSNSETPWERILRKCKENPLVPGGAAVTVGALSYGLYNFVIDRQQMQQKMMRLRVGAQLFTILAAVGGVLYSLPPEKRNLKDFIKSGERVIDAK
ncbi:hypothetical protein TSAR_013848 [Trichomalopsis sarcophagae]|uniref:HIG1 domain-containing protein n=1 Tax=Trichomalopsis sarcophagae TaxID=543379 RepID=A0A232F956_9HYME|nr:hypothetical protein TSAR_013848 [Trichomalopsis sarcophagae]